MLFIILYNEIIAVLQAKAEAVFEARSKKNHISCSLNQRFDFIRETEKKILD